MRIKVLYISRNKNLGYSISRVFAPIIEGMREYCDVDSISLPYASNSLQDIMRNIIYVKKHIRGRNFDVLHITGPEHYLLPFLINHKSIVTIHDLGRYYNISRIRKIAYWAKQIFPLVFAKRTIAISRVALREITNTNIIKEKKVTIIPDCLSDDYQYNCKIINVANPRILHIGTGVHKNLSKTIEALCDIPCHLVIIGKLAIKDKALLNKYKIRYTNKYSLSDEEILEEYRLADIVNFPSLHEGFGMPIIEAQAIGRPVVTSILEPMRSVAGVHGASFCDPKDALSIKEAYLSILHDNEFYKRIIIAGLDNVKKYRKDICVKMYYSVYNEIAK